MEWLTDVLTWIADVPKESKGTIVGALIAAGISALTAIISNWNSRRIVRLQLRSAERQAELKRTMQLREDVFLPAARASGVAILVSAKMINPETRQDELNSEVADVVSKINALHVIASERTLDPLVDLGEKIGLLFSTMDQFRIEILQAHGRFKAHSEIVDKEIRNGDALIEMMRANNLGDQSDESQRKIDDQWKLHRELLAKWEATRDAEAQHFRSLTAAAHKRWSELALDMVPEQTKALIAIREELGLPLDGEWYTKKMNRVYELAARVAQETQSRLNPSPIETSGKSESPGSATTS